MPRPELSTLRYPHLWQGCVGAWCPSQSGATGYRLFDDSGNNNHGVLTGMDPGTDWVPSGGKLALDFDGSNDYVALGSGLAKAGSFSVAGWANVATGYGTNPQICSRAIYGGNYPQNWMLFIRTDEGTAQYALQTTDSFGVRYQIKGGGLVQTNVWTHVCASYNINGANLYINGNPVAVTTVGTPNATPVAGQVVNIGAYANVTNFFNGQLDDLRIYNRALTPSEINLLYTGGRGAAYQLKERGRKKAYVPGYRITAPSRIQIGSARTIDGTDTESLRRGLVGAWVPSLGASGYRLIDRSGYGNHGTLTNMDPGTDWVPSGGKLALDFDGVNDYVATDLSCSNRQNLDISAWIFKPSTSNNAFVGAGEGGSSGPRANIYIFGTTTFVTAESTGTVSYGQVANTRTGWNHFHYSFLGNAGPNNTDRMKLWINGMEQSLTFTGTIPTTSLGNVGFFEIGRSKGESSYATAQIDDVRAWSRRLTPSEIRLLYTGGRGVGLMPEVKPKRARIVAWDNQDKISVPARVLTNTDSLKRGLVGHWSPSVSGPQGNRLMDLSGQNNHGTLTNMDYQTDYIPNAEKGGRMALDFDGSNDYVAATSPQIGQLTKNISVSIWQNLGATGRIASLFGLNTVSSINERMQAHCPWSDGVIYWDFGGYAGDNRLSVSGQNLTVGNWDHFVFLAGDIGMQIWRNGRLIGSNSTPITRVANSNTFLIGSANMHDVGGVIYYHRGNIDDCRIYNRVLTPNEIRLLAQSRMPERATPQRTRTVFYSSGLISYLRRRSYNSILGSGVLS